MSKPVIPDYMPNRQPSLEVDITRDATFKGAIETGRACIVTGVATVSRRTCLTVKPQTADDYADLIVAAILDSAGNSLPGTGTLDDTNPISRGRVLSSGGFTLALSGDTLMLGDEATIGAAGLVKLPMGAAWSYGRIVEGGTSGNYCVLDVARRKL